MKEILSAKNLAVGYGSSIVAQHIDLSLKKGELYALVGINGAGKSTLLRTLAGLQPKIAGQLCLAGRAMESYTLQNLATKIALVLTEPLASKNLTVTELVALGRQPYTNWLGRLTHNDKKHIMESIERVGLDRLKEKKCGELSDGQLQRVLIARALAQDTPILLLDEPTTHLDLAHKIEILALLKQLAHTNGKTILLTTHEVNLALQMCDKLVLLNGKENPFGAPKGLIENGYFKTFFSSESIVFDREIGQFKIKK